MAESPNMPPTPRSGRRSSLRDRSGYWVCAALGQALDFLDWGSLDLINYAALIDVGGLPLLPREAQHQLQRIHGWVSDGVLLPVVIKLYQAAAWFDLEAYARDFRPKG